MATSSNETTLIIHWVFSFAAIVIMTVRLGWRKLAKQSFNLGDYLTMGAILCALTRLALIHVVLTWGTSNMPDIYRATHKFTATEIYQREIGSKLSLVNRFIYNTYLWVQKLVLLDVFRRLLVDLKHEKIIVWSYLGVFFITYVAVQSMNLVECRPLHLYWQILPDPGDCITAPAQLLVMGILNIVTDVMLLILPLPVVLTLKAPWRRKLQLCILFTLGIFIVAITIIRLPINSMHLDSQVSRTTWASTELLAAAIVVNAPSLYGLWNKHRRYRAESARQRVLCEGQGNNSGPVYPDTIGGGNEVGSIQRKCKPTAQERLLTTDTTMTEVYKVEDKRRSSGSTPTTFYFDEESAVRGDSPHSSQREILH